MSSTPPELSPEAKPESTASDERYYRITELSRLAGVKSFVLRYWESEFPMLQPIKSTTGYRLYRQQDADLVFTIKRMLYEDGLTIAGARRQLEERAARDQNAVASGTGAATNENGATATGEQAQKTSAHANGAKAHSNGKLSAADREALVELREALRHFLTLLERK